MFLGRDALRSIELFHQLSLYNPVFFHAIPRQISSTFTRSDFDLDKGLANSVILKLLLDGKSPDIPAVHPLFTKHYHEDASAKPRLSLACALSPYQGVFYKDKKGKELPAVEAVVRESLKLGAQNHYLDGIPVLFLAVEPFRQLLEKYDAFLTETSRSSTGQSIPHCSPLSEGSQRLQASH